MFLTPLMIDRGLIYCFHRAMKFLADLHIHSRYSRATSKGLCAENLFIWARKKGLTLLGTGDFTHPAWLEELKGKLIEAEPGLYRLSSTISNSLSSAVPESCQVQTRFILSGEISCIYKKDGKTRKVHHLLLMPSFESLERFNRRLAKIGNLGSDGRPILGLDSHNLLEIMLESDRASLLIPAHIWTPWFSIFGSKSGFDTLEECFGDLTSHIRAFETGLSSDPLMNRLLSGLDHLNLISNSDAHSAPKLGREATIFDTSLDYETVRTALTTGEGLNGTVEFFPEEGKYHLDGHRNCNIRYAPAQTEALNERCPVCGRPLTVGVLNRVMRLANRERPLLQKPFFSVIPLAEILSEIMNCGEGTRKVADQYERLIAEMGPELDILLTHPIESICSKGGSLLAEAISRMRRTQVIKDEGYDGEYGKIRLFKDGEIESIKGQEALFIFDPAPAEPAGQRGRISDRAPSRTHDPAVTSGSDHRDPILDPLNPEQKNAVTYKEGHALIIAGPGTGKTLTLIHRIAYLLGSGRASPSEILALTFTRKASKEMRQRISSLLTSCGLYKGEAFLPFTGTFHGFCLDLLRMHEALNSPDLPFTSAHSGPSSPLSLCPEWEAQKIARDCLIKCGRRAVSIQNFLRAAGDLKRAEALSLPSRSSSMAFLEPYREYRMALKERNLLDYDDLELDALRLLQGSEDLLQRLHISYRWIMVDEYQDTNPAQAEIVERLSRRLSAAVFAIGDPDQAIYGFRGAEPAGFIEFLNRFPGAKAITLTTNYRSSETILKAAASLMGKKAPLISSISEDAPIAMAACGSAFEEAEMVAKRIEDLMGGISHFSLDAGRVSGEGGDAYYGFGDIAVLYRLNAMGDAIEEALDRASIPFSRIAEKPVLARYPVDFLSAFLFCMRYGDKPLYRKNYEDACRKYHASARHQDQMPEEISGLDGLLDEALAIHGLKISGQGEVEALSALKHLARDAQGDLTELLDILALERGLDLVHFKGDRVALMSIHAAKGLEWPIVFLIGCEEGLMPCTIFKEKDEEEERRLFYVAVTRARVRLTLSWASHRSLLGISSEGNPSRFLSQIPSKLMKPIEDKGKRPRTRRPSQMALFT